VKGLVERIQPALVRASRGSVGGGAYLNHLLPLPYDTVRLEATEPARRADPGDASAADSRRETRHAICRFLFFFFFFF